MSGSSYSVLVRYLPRPSLAWLKTHPGLMTVLALVLFAGVLGWYHQHIPFSLQITVWAMLLVVFAFTMRFRWMALFGPVFVYDLVRSTRRSHFAALRGFYAGAMLIVLFLAYSSVVQTPARTLWDTLWQPGTVPVKSLARFGEAFFYSFVAVQFIAMLLFTPICAAGAITEEKERRTLEFVLITDLSDREVVLGKLAARLAYLVLFLLTGLPILCLLQFVGGVSPNLVIASFLMTGVSMISLASLSVAISVFSNKTRGAVFFAYVAVVIYLLCSSCCCAMPVPWLTAGNFVIAVRRLFDPAAGGVEDNLLGIFIEYTSFHTVAATVCCIWAAINLRMRSEKQPAVVTITVPQTVLYVEALDREGRGQTDGEPLDPAAMPPPRRRRIAYTPLDPPAKRRPPISDQPILWKELYAEPFIRPGPGGQTLLMVLGVMGLLMGGYVLLLSMAAAVSSSSVAIFTNVLVRYFGSGVACLMLLGIGLRAASTLTSERDRQTLDSLLTTLLENSAILSGKWLGSILGVRKVWFVLAPIWALALITGGVHPLALVLLAVAWCVFAAFEAGLGMCFSLICRNTLVASIATMLTTLVLSGGPWGMWSLYVSGMYQNRTPDGIVWIEQFLLYGLTPPVTLGVLSFRSEDFAAQRPLLSWETVRYALYGLGLYAGVAALMWKLLVSRFPVVTGRMPIGEPGLAPADELAGKAR
ncbi:MAG TPA: ABC transporter permease [Gemmataceae bacterium]|jgi:ABC-type transport system involved in multi-copper enzyme maturation permease subunit|nr:ABC transporter permease [Gemmataceae bacterium]